MDDVLARLEVAQARLVPASARRLRISTVVSFSESWLVPQLPDFERLHPELAVEVEATTQYADFQRDGVDVAIRFGVGPWEGLYSEPIVELEFFPVCAPTLARSDLPLGVPADLARHTLLHMTQVPDLWRSWLRLAGLPELRPRREVSYDHVALVLSAAESGQGVALATLLGCESRLRDGRLCRPFGPALASKDTFHFVCRRDALEDAATRALRDWLVERLRLTQERLRSLRLPA